MKTFIITTYNHGDFENHQIKASSKLEAMIKFAEKNNLEFDSVIDKTKEGDVEDFLIESFAEGEMDFQIFSLDQLKVIE